jgi:hypothetical protein
LRTSPRDPDKKFAGYRSTGSKKEVAAAPKVLSTPILPFISAMSGFGELDRFPRLASAYG